MDRVVPRGVRVRPVLRGGVAVNDYMGGITEVELDPDSRYDDVETDGPEYLVNDQAVGPPLTTSGGRLTTPCGRLVLPSSAPRDQWLAARRDGITATDLVAIMGQSQYSNTLDVWQAKTHGDTWDEIGEAGQWGMWLEDVVAKKWATDHGYTIRRIGLLARDGDDWSRASLDRVVVDGCDIGTIDIGCGLEVKTRNAWVADQWDDTIPESVVTQVQWQMFVAGYAHMHVAALIGGQRLVEHIVHRDDALIDRLIAAGSRLWAQVLAGQLPDVDPNTWTTEMLDRFYPNREGQVDVGDQAQVWLDLYQAAHVDIKAADQVKDTAKLQLLALLGSGEIAVDGERVLFTYKASDTTRVNAKALAADWPDAYAAVTTTTTNRTFRPAGKGK
jgi:putative phage-type endonuclease